MTSLNDLLESINPGMRLTKEFFRRVYGYELYNPGFADMAVSRLEAAGCSRARCYYEAWVSEYEAKYEKEMKEVAAWYHKRLREELLKKLRKGRKKVSENERDSNKCNSSRTAYNSGRRCRRRWAFNR